MLRLNSLKSIFLVGLFLTPFFMFAQTGKSLQRVTVTSVTIILDSIQSEADVDIVKNEITKHTEVQDFDIKGKNCNFTIDNSHNTLDIIFSDLAQRGQPARVYAIEANQTFTHVPEESCMSKKATELKEEESLKTTPAPKGSNK